MSTPSGFTNQKKVPADTQHQTVNPVGEQLYATDVNSHLFVRTVGSDAAEANSSTTQIVATAHAALRGDIIRITSGALIGKEVVVHSVEANAIILGEALTSAPAAAVTFDILRHTKPSVDDEGRVNVVASVSTGPNQFVLDGVDTEVSRDTAIPANSTPFPVAALNAAGTPVDFATQTTLAALNGKVVAVDTGAVVVASSALPAGAATQATLSALNTKVTAVDTGAVVIASSALPSGAATQATLAALNTKVTAVDTGAVVIASSALPSGAATEATLSAQSAKLPATLGQKAMTASLAVVLASDQSALPIAAAVGRTALAKARNDYTSVSVTTGAYVQLISTVGATQVNAVEIFDSSGQTLVLAIGAAASEVDQVYIVPGGNGVIPLKIAAGSRVSVKAVSATASAGELTVNFYG